MLDYDELDNFEEEDYDDDDCFDVAKNRREAEEEAKMYEEEENARLKDYEYFDRFISKYDIIKDDLEDYDDYDKLENSLELDELYELEDVIHVTFEENKLSDINKIIGYVCQEDLLECSHDKKCPSCHKCVEVIGEYKKYCVHEYDIFLEVYEKGSDGQWSWIMPIKNISDDIFPLCYTDLGKGEDGFIFLSKIYCYLNAV